MKSIINELEKESNSNKKGVIYRIRDVYERDEEMENMDDATLEQLALSGDKKAARIYNDRVLDYLWENDINASERVEIKMSESEEYRAEVERQTELYKSHKFNQMDPDIRSFLDIKESNENYKKYKEFEETLKNKGVTIEYITFEEHRKMLSNSSSK